MELTKETIVNDVLKAHPELPEKIKKLGKEYEMAVNPITIMMVKNKSIGELIKQFNLDEKKVFKKLEELLGED